MSNLVNFVVGTYAAYARSTKDANTLYFLSDTHQIMKGDYDYGSSVIVASSLPTAGIPTKLYLVDERFYMWEKVEGGWTWNLIYDLRGKADLSGATFTGPVILKRDPEENLEAATKHYVDIQISSKDAMTYKGTIGIGGTVEKLPITDVRSGDTYRVITAGTYAGSKCEIGDMLIALETKPSGSTDSNWTVVQSNIDGAVIGPTSSIEEDVPIFEGSSGKLIKDSGVKIGKAEFSEEKSQSILATEAGVASFVEDNVPTWGTIE